MVHALRNNPRDRLSCTPLIQIALRPLTWSFASVVVAQIRDRGHFEEAMEDGGPQGAAACFTWGRRAGAAAAGAVRQGARPAPAPAGPRGGTAPPGGRRRRRPPSAAAPPACRGGTARCMPGASENSWIVHRDSHEISQSDPTISAAINLTIGSKPNSTAGWRIAAQIKEQAGGR